MKLNLRNSLGCTAVLYRKASRKCKTCDVGIHNKPRSNSDFHRTPYDRYDLSLKRGLTDQDLDFVLQSNHSHKRAPYFEIFTRNQVSPQTSCLGDVAPRFRRRPLVLNLGFVDVRDQNPTKKIGCKTTTATRRAPSF